jgi:D-alanyl-D-alanine carboxypeptidase
MDLGKSAWIAFALAGCMAGDASDVAERSPGGDPAIEDGVVAGHARGNPLQARLQDGLDALFGHGMVGTVGEVSDGRDRIVARSGVARVGRPEPVAFDSRFRMGSNTKTFVAVVMLQLVEDGKIRLDDSVDHWLPGVVSGNGNDGRRVTVRNLLQHTSGIFDYTEALLASFSLADYRRMRFQHVDPEQLVAMAMAHAPRFAPDAGWSYSNTNYLLAGMIIKKVTGHAWSSEVRTRILAPLGMSQTLDPGDWPDLPAPHADGYQTFTDDGPLVDVTLFNHTLADAAGALVTTTRDLTRFWRALQSGKLLGRAAMAEMHSTVDATELQAAIPGLRYGLGILWVPTSCGGGYWGHLGDTFGFSTRNGVSEDGTRAVVVSQNTTPWSGAATLQFLDDDLQLVDQVMCVGR